MNATIRILLLALPGALIATGEPPPPAPAPPPERAPAPPPERAPGAPAERRPGGERVGPRGGQGAGRPAAESWQRLDSDGSGALSFEEFAATPRLVRLPDERKREIFGRLDKDGDGAIQPAELAPPGPPGGRPRGPMPLRELDRNGDGRIDFGEFAGSRFVDRLPEDKRRALFERMDLDGNGVIDGRDRPRGVPPPLQRLGELDKDGSGGVSFAEFSAGEAAAKLPEHRRRALFDRHDRNRDGEIRPGELPKWGGPERRTPERRTPAPAAARRFEELDRDGDGFLGPDEFAHWPAAARLDADARRARFAQLDANADQRLDRPEFSKGVRPQRKPADRQPAAKGG